MIFSLAQIVHELDEPTKLIIQRQVNWLEIGVIILLFLLLFAITFVVAFIYRSATYENRKTHKELQELHRDERREWNRENKQTVDRVAHVVSELTGTIKATNIHIQQNADGSIGTQAQTGDANV